MKIFLKPLLIVMGAAIGLAVGLALRERSVFNTDESVSNTSAATAPAKRISHPNRRAGISVHDDSPLTTKLEQDLSTSSGITRWLYWLEALERAAPADFPRLVGLAKGNPAALRLVEERWVDVAPRHLFDTIVAAMKDRRGLDVSELAQILFAEWPKRDPDAAIRALNEADNLRSRWGFTLAYALVEKDIERGLKLFSEWHVDNVGFGTRGLAAVARWARADPRHAAEFMLDQPEGYSIRSTMETIGKEWSITDPAAALAFATSKPGTLGSMLATSIMKEWAERNLSEAADWLTKVDEGTRRRLNPTFVATWAKQDAGGALQWCQENLTGSSLAQSVAGVVSSAAEKDVAAAATLVAGMNPSQARAEAAVAVARKWFPNSFLGQQVKPETVTWLATLDVDSVKRVLDHVAWGWATSDPKSMAAFLGSVSGEQVPPNAYAVVARELGRKNPREALEWAKQLPEQSALTAGSNAFAEWRSSQPEAAVKWLNALPADDARRQPFFQKAIQYLAYHPQAAEQLAAMTPTERDAARNVIKTMDLPEDRRIRLLDVLTPH